MFATEGEPKKGKKMTDSLKTVRTRKGFAATAQTQRADKREVKNSAGGYVFKTKDMVQVRRFLILGAA